MLQSFILFLSLGIQFLPADFAKFFASHLSFLASFAHVIEFFYLPYSNVTCDASAVDLPALKPHCVIYVSYVFYPFSHSCSMILARILLAIDSKQTPLYLFNSLLDPFCVMVSLVHFSPRIPSFLHHLCALFALSQVHSSKFFPCIFQCLYHDVIFPCGPIMYQLDLSVKFIFGYFLLHQISSF